MSERSHTVLLLTFARRGEEGAIRAAMASIRHSYPSARIFAVGTPVSEPSIRAVGLEQILVIGGKQPTRRVLEEIHLNMPEATAIVYDGIDFAGHLKLEGLALLAGAPVVLRCRREGEPIRLGRFQLAGVVLRKIFAMVFRMGMAWTVAVRAGALLSRYWYMGGRRADRP